MEHLLLQLNMALLQLGRSDRKPSVYINNFTVFILHIHFPDTFELIKIIFGISTPWQEADI